MLLLQSAQLVKNPSAMQGTLVHGKICWRKDRLPTPVFLGFPCGSADKESACNAGDLGSIPELGRSPGEGKGFPLQCSGLENSMNYIVHGVAKSWTDWATFTFPFLFSTLRESCRGKLCTKEDWSLEPSISMVPLCGSPISLWAVRVSRKGTEMDEETWPGSSPGSDLGKEPQCLRFNFLIC